MKTRSLGYRLRWLSTKIVDLMCLLPTASVNCGLVLCGCVVPSREPLSLIYLVEGGGSR